MAGLRVEMVSCTLLRTLTSTTSTLFFCREATWKGQRAYRTLQGHSAMSFMSVTDMDSHFSAALVSTRLTHHIKSALSFMRTYSTKKESHRSPLNPVQASSLAASGFPVFHSSLPGSRQLRWL